MKSGWIEQRTVKRGTSFRVRYWAPNASGDVVPNSKSFGEWRYGGKRKAEEAAKAFLAKMLTEVRSGDYLAPVETSLGDLVATHLTNKEGHISESTLYVYRAAVKHLSPEVAAISIQRLRASHLQTLYASLRAAGTGDGIVRMLHAVISASLAQAVKWELIRRNPAIGVTPPPARKAPMPYWTPEQSAIFLQLEGERDPFGLLWSLIILTGMRAGEAMALRWTDLHIERRTITVLRTVTRTKTGGYRIGDTTKTRNSRRTIPLPASLIEPLRHHRVKQLERQLASPEWSTDDGDLLFTNDLGRMLPYGSVGIAFKEAVIRSGLPMIGMHGLRHSYATAMLIAGVHPQVCADLLGDQVSMILKVYSHVTVEARQDAAVAFDARITRLREDLPVATDG